MSSTNGPDDRHAELLSELGPGYRVIGDAAYSAAAAHVIDALPDDVRDDPYALEEIDKRSLAAIWSVSGMASEIANEVRARRHRESLSAEG